jgi:hypothetical protein
MIDWKERQRKLSRQSRAFDAQDTVTRNFTVTGQKDFIDRLTRHIAFIKWLGDVGHSCVAGISVDGDGSDRLRVAEKLPSIKENGVKTHGTYPDQWENAEAMDL